MPPLIAAVIGFVVALLPSLIARTLISLGIGVATYIGAGLVIDYAFEQLTVAVNGLPLKALQMAALMKFDVCVNLIMGAVNARLGMITLNGMFARFQINPAAYTANT